MLQFTSQTLATLDTDALLIEIDCLGHALEDPQLQLRQHLPEAYQELKRAFDAGLVEPGCRLKVSREGKHPRLVFMLPSRVHPRGLTRREYVEQPLRRLLDELLQNSVRSLAVLRPEAYPSDDLSQFKLYLLSAFAHAPDIKLVQPWLAPGGKASKQVVIFSDGGAKGPMRRSKSGDHRQEVGGFGVVLRFGENTKELSQAFRLTSASRMELMAALTGLEALKEPCRVRLHSDSRYVVDTVRNGLLFRHAANQWSGCKLKNIDLWKRFLDAYLRHEVELVWVKGHAGLVDNERCDQLAGQAMSQPDLPIDGAQSAENPPSTGSSNASAIAQAPETPSVPTVAPAPLATPSQAVARRGPKPKLPGDPCRHCHQPLERRQSRSHSPTASYWYEWHLFCPACKRIYHTDAARVERT